MGRLRYIKGSVEAVAASIFVIHSPDPEGYFPEDRPLHIEVGMGKGRFIMDMGRLHPEINYIGVERYESVLLRALQKYERLREAGEALTNVRFLSEDAQKLGDYFPPGSVDRIYLNFSDPWPKDRHAHRRLVSEGFLKIFHGILSEDGQVEFKTDNDGLFDYALTQVEAAGFETVCFTRDLHNDPVMGRDNVMTEYEERFSSLGNRISKVIMRKKPL